METKIMQVNLHTLVDGEISFSITEWNEIGYVGRLTDTVYSDGCSYTDWCEFIGTIEECEEYIRQPKFSEPLDIKVEEEYVEGMFDYDDQDPLYC